MKNYLTEDNLSYFSSWVKLYKTWNHSLYLEKAGYFDERPLLHTSITQIIALFAVPILVFFSWWWLFAIPLLFFGWGKLYIYLPIKTGIQDCDSAAWGFNYHDNKIWIYIGGGGNFEGGKKWKTITMPWDMTWVRTSTLLKEINTEFTSTNVMIQNKWFNETSKNRKLYQGIDEGSYDWLEANKWTETFPFVDYYDNTTLNATIGVSEREWRPLWFQWTSLFNRKRRCIDIEFDQEVGKKKGSWKGGTIGCSYDLLPNETPKECLERMQKERKF